MRIAFILTAFHTDGSAQEFWEYGFCQINQATALATLGHDVIVISRYSENKEVKRNGVTYCFVNDDNPPNLRSWQYSNPVLRKLRIVNPDIVHFHGLEYPVFILRLLLAIEKRTKLLVEYHGDSRLRFPMNVLQFLSLRRVENYIFTNSKKAEEWSARSGVSLNRIHFSVECAPNRVKGDRITARKSTGFSGNPIIIWNSRAIKRRNPDIVIDAFERYLQSIQNPKCHFYMMVPDYDADVLEKIKTMSTQSALLKKHFTLVVDRKPQTAMTDYYNSSDYIISGSEDDPYGYGVVDAMSCGVIPIVTKSSTFREITNEGKIGLSWDVTNPSSLVEALNNMSSDKGEIERNSHEVLSFFYDRLSMEAQGRDLEAIYTNVLR